MKKNLLFFVLIPILGLFACTSDSDETVVPVISKTESVVNKDKSGSNARFDNSNLAVAEELVNLGYTLDENDSEHYSYYYGGLYEVTVHFRADPIIGDKYKITYESSGHVGEELLYNGYIHNASAISYLSGVSGLYFDGLQ